MAQPFYERLLVDGSRALLSGDHETAARQLRLAAFGLLDDPPSLVAALVPLTLAQVALQDEAGASESISRVLDAERRFDAYAAAVDGKLALDVRREFEALLVERFTEAQLRALGSLAPLADQRLERDLAALGVAERRARLEELAAASPNDTRWSARLAQMSLDAGQLEVAIAYATQVLDREPSRVDAMCVRGVARAESGQCEGAVTDLARCPSALEVERFAVARIDCLARLGSLEEATAALAGLPPALLAQREMRRLERSVNDRIDAAARQASIDQRRQAQMEAAAAREAERASRRQPASGTEAAGDPQATETESAQVPPAGEPPAETAPASSTTARPATVAPTRVPESSAVPQDSGRATVTPPKPDTSPDQAPAGQRTVAPGDPGAARNRPVVEDSRIPPAGEPTAVQIRRMVEKARTPNDFVAPLQLARQLADSYPGSRDAQHLAAEVAYRASQWSESVAFFDRGGLPGAERPELSFYEAVARYEIGDLAGARVALDRALPHIRRTPFVERYVARIHGTGSGDGARP